jgi:hypothetical protein
MQGLGLGRVAVKAAKRMARVDLNPGVNSLTEGLLPYNRFLPQMYGGFDF